MVGSLPICLFQETELSGFVTDYLQKAYIPVVNGEASPRIRMPFPKAGASTSVVPKTWESMTNA